MADDIQITPVNAAWAFLLKNADGQEAVISMVTKRGMMPLICFSEDGLEGMKAVAKDMVKATGKPMTLVKFSNREEVEVIEPPLIEEAPDRFRGIPRIGG
jgi:hypothetical protein